VNDEGWGNLFVGFKIVGDFGEYGFKDIFGEFFEFGEFFAK